MLGKAVLLVLIAYITDSFVARGTTGQVTVSSTRVGRRGTRRGRYFLVPITGPRALRGLVTLTLIIHSPGRGRGLITLGIVGSGKSSPHLRVHKQHALRETSRVATSIGIRLGAIDHFSLGVAAKVVRATGRCSTADVIVKLRCGSDVISSFFKGLARGLLGGACRRIVVTHFLVPIGALQHVVMTIPPGTRFRRNFIG